MKPGARLSFFRIKPHTSPDNGWVVAGPGSFKSRGPKRIERKQGGKVLCCHLISPCPEPPAARGGGPGAPLTRSHTRRHRHACPHPTPPRGPAGPGPRSCRTARRGVRRRLPPLPPTRLAAVTHPLIDGWMATGPRVGGARTGLPLKVECSRRAPQRGCGGGDGARCDAVAL